MLNMDDVNNINTIENFYNLNNINYIRRGFIFKFFVCNEKIFYKINNVKECIEKGLYTKKLEKYLLLIRITDVYDLQNIILNYLNILI